MNEYGCESKPKDGYSLSIPPTIDEIDAVQCRISRYTNPSNPRSDRLEGLGATLDRFHEALLDHPKGYQREAQAIKDLADLAFNCANDLRAVN